MVDKIRYPGTYTVKYDRSTVTVDVVTGSDAITSLDANFEPTLRFQ